MVCDTSNVNLQYNYFSDARCSKTTSKLSSASPPCKELPDTNNQAGHFQQNLRANIPLLGKSYQDGHQHPDLSRFSLNQWRAALHQSGAPSPLAPKRRLKHRTSSFSCPPDPDRCLVASSRNLNHVEPESCTALSTGSCVMDRVGADAWLLVLLFSDTSAMSAAAVLDSSCAKARLADCEGPEDTKMGLRLEQLAAWLRSGVSLFREALPWCQLPQPPAQCGDQWMNVLRQQEEDALWVCIFVMNGRAQFVKDFPNGIELAAECSQNEGVSANDISPAGSPGARPLVVVLPSAKYHRSVQERIVVHHSLSVLGLSVPLASGPSRAILIIGGLEICKQSEVELRNLTIMGSGTSAEKGPRGACDSVVRVSQGRCIITDSDIRIAARQAGFGVAVGSGSLKSMSSLSKAPLAQPSPQASLRNCSISQCSTGCMIYLGGQVEVDAQCAFEDCNVGICVCDRDSMAVVKKEAPMFHRCAQDTKTLCGGVVKMIGSSN